MVVAVVAVRVVQVPGDEVVDVVAVRNGSVATIGAVDVVLGVPAASVLRGAVCGVGFTHGQGVLFDACARDVVQVPIVDVVNMVAMLNGGVPTVGAMLVGMVFVRAHDSTSVSKC